MTNRWIFLCIGLLFIAGCGHVEGTIQKAERSYLTFSGNLDAVSIQLDDRTPFAPQPGTHYQISPGKHTLLAHRGDRLVVKRTLVLENQTTMEINIP